MTNTNDYRDLALAYHRRLPAHVRAYLYGRGISISFVHQYQLEQLRAWLEKHKVTHVALEPVVNWQMLAKGSALEIPKGPIAQLRSGTG